MAVNALVCIDRRPPLCLAEELPTCTLSDAPIDFFERLPPAIRHNKHPVTKALSEKGVGMVTGLVTSKAITAVDQQLTGPLKKNGSPLVQIGGYLMDWIASLGVGSATGTVLGTALDAARGDKIDKKSIERRAINGTVVGMMGKFFTPVKATKILPPP